MASCKCLYGRSEDLQADGNRGIKLADAKYYIYIIYGACIIAMILVAGPSMWLVKKRHDRRERSKLSNGGGMVSHN